MGTLYEDDVIAWAGEAVRKHLGRLPGRYNQRCVHQPQPSMKKTLLQRLIPAMLAIAGLGAMCAVHAEDSGPAAWNVAIQPFKIYGNSYYVGLAGLSSVLITSDQGHILIDGGLPQSAARIAHSVGQLGFSVKDIKLILSSHVHDDHAGGIAELQRLSGATVLASPSAAEALRRGRVGDDDPQLADSTPYPPVAQVRTVRDGEVVSVGPLAVTALYTPGHTPGGTSWTWRACEGARCASIVYADSINPISSDDFSFTRNTRYPGIVGDFARTFAALDAAPCDILVSAHPDFDGPLGQLKNGQADAVFDDGLACKRYVAKSRDKLRLRLAAEAAN